MQDIFVDSLLQKDDWNEICIWRGGASGRPGRLLDQTRTGLMKMPVTFANVLASTK